MSDELRKQIEEYTRLIEMDGAPIEQIAKALLNRGGAYGELNQQQKAIKDYTRLIGMEGVPIEMVALALFNRGVTYGEHQQQQQEIEDYTRLIDMEDAPIEQVAEALRNRGGAYGELNQQQKAIKDYTRLIGTEGVPIEQIAKALYDRGVTYGELNQQQQKIADYTRLIGMEGAPIEQVADALFNRGVAYENLNQQQKAIDDFTQLIHMEGATIERVARALQCRGGSFGKLHLYQQAIEDFTRLIDMEGAPIEEVAEAMRNRGGAYGELNQQQKAIKDYTRLIGMEGVPIEWVAKALFHRGVDYKELNQQQQAIEDFTRYISMEGVPIERVAKALLHRGETYEKLNQQQQAIEDYLATVELAKRHADRVDFPWVVAAWAYFKLGEVTESQKCCQRFVSSNSTHAIEWINCANLIHQRGHSKNDSLSSSQCLCRTALLLDGLQNARRTTYEDILLETNALPLLEYRLCSSFTLHAGIDGIRRRAEIHSALEVPLAVIDWLENNASNSREEFLLRRSQIDLAFGDPVSAYGLLDELDALDDSHVAGQAYWLWANEDCLMLDVDPSILQNAVESADQACLSTGVSDIDCYYSGHIYYMAGNKTKALKAFDQAGKFLPAMYMSWVMSTKIDEGNSAAGRLERALKQEAKQIESGLPGLLAPYDLTAFDAKDPFDSLVPVIRRHEISEAIALIHTSHAGHVGKSPQLNRILDSMYVRNRGGQEFADWSDWMEQWNRAPNAKDFLKAFRRNLSDGWLAEQKQTLRPYLGSLAAIDASSDSKKDIARKLEIELADTIYRTRLIGTYPPLEQIISYYLVKKRFSTSAALRLLQYFHTKEQHDQSVTTENFRVSEFAPLAGVAVCAIWAGDSSLLTETFALLAASQRPLTKAVIKTYQRIAASENGQFPIYETFIQRLCDVDQDDSKAVAAIQQILNED